MKGFVGGMGLDWVPMKAKKGGSWAWTKSKILYLNIVPAKYSDG